MTRSGDCLRYRRYNVVRVKICGITRVEDVLAVAMSGADAIGLVFYEKSPRHVSIEQAVKLVAASPPFVTVVGLFVNASAESVREVLKSVSLDVLQFHGDETPEYCEQFLQPYLKAIRVKPGVDLLQCAARYRSAQGLLLDAHVEGVPGGTGAVFDWTLIPEHLPLPLILSGGLDAENVAQGIKQVRPYAVDVSSGVEAAKGINTLKGIKDAAKIVRFMQEVGKLR
ncbi:MAG: phosphoribosylanthranilate isomerase [Proteobacteria bacterium]|nr:phosphoribosylanthranilate isomerase [Pseudomonadota bacterium]